MPRRRVIVLWVAIVATVACAATVVNDRSVDLVALDSEPAKRSDDDPNEPILAIEYRGAGGHRALELTRSKLEKLSVRRIETSTPFTQGVLSLSGPDGDAIAGLVSAIFETVRLTSLNGRTVEIEAQVFLEQAVLATRRSGEKIKVRDNGPFWLVYDFDAADLAEGEFLRARSLAHVKSLSFR